MEVRRWRTNLNSSIEASVFALSTTGESATDVADTSSAPLHKRRQTTISLSGIVLRLELDGGSCSAQRQGEREQRIESCL